VVPQAALAEGNPPDVECAGYDFYFKIDNIGDGGIVAGTYTGSSTDVDTNWNGQEITISNVATGGQSFDWASTLTVSQVVSKEGSSESVSTTGLPGTSGSVSDLTQQGLSHVTFCGDAQPEVTPTPEPTATPEPEVTPTPEPEVTPTPEPEVTPTPTATPVVTPTPPGTLFSVPAFSIVCGGSITVTNFASANVDDVLITPGGTVIAADGTYPLAPGDYTAVGRVGGDVVTDEVEFTIVACPTATPAPSGTVEAETGTPRVTPPSTDAGGMGGSGTSGNSLGFVLLLLGGLSLAGALLRPAGSRIRR
jgi:hypothetical protein